MSRNLQFWWGFLCGCLFLLVKMVKGLIRVQVEQMTDLCCEMEPRTGFNLPQWSPQSSRIKRAQLNMPLKGIHPSGWSCCCLMTASTEFSLAWLHTCACITPVLVWFFSKDLLSVSSTVCLERRRLEHASPPVMIAVSRSRSLYHRLHSDVKDGLAVFSLSLYASDTTAVHLSRWANATITS